MKTFDEILHEAINALNACMYHYTGKHLPLDLTGQIEVLLDHLDFNTSAEWENYSKEYQKRICLTKLT